MKVFFSNRYEILSVLLGEEIFLKKKNPFAKRCVVVPSQTVKNDLLFRWAEDPRFQVATGISVWTLGQALHYFFPHVPSMMELSLKIEACLEKKGAVLSYLESGGAKRLAGLCNQLSALFLKQGTFRGGPFEESWLEELWKKVGLSWEATASLPDEIYLFNLAFLPLQYLEFFKAHAEAGYFVSPTPLYWGDVATPREQQFLLRQAPEAQKNELQGYFENQNQLVAHLGKMGRHMWNELQECAVHENYAEPEGFALHQQMMRLEPMEINGEVEIHAAPSKSREVEVVWDILQRLEADYNEVVVLAPDINAYLPYIHKVFQGEGYSITGLEARLEHVEHLFNLPELKFSVEAVLRLLSYSSFLEKFKFSKDDILQIKKWTEQANCDVGGWDEGFGRLLRTLASIPEEDDPAIEFSQAELLGKWIEVIQLLKKELSPIEKNSEKSAAQWMEYFQKTVHAFFAIEAEDSFFSELKKYSLEGCYSFESIRRVLEEIFGKKSGGFQTGNLRALRFASFASGSIVPARVYIIMGMEEGSFPRVEQKKPLNEVKGDYCPSSVEEDRYLFLEAVMAAQEKLILSYPFTDPEDGKEKMPSLLIQELFSTVEVQRHPLLPFDNAYFQKEGFRTASKLYAKAAESYYGPKKEAGQPLIEVPALLQKKEEAVIDISRLKKLARHPVEFFLQRKCGIYFEREKRSGKEFALSHLDLAYFRRASLKRGMKDITLLAEAKGKLPVGPFRTAALHRIEEDVEEYHTALNSLGVKKDEIFSVEFKASCTEAVQMRENEWIAPPLDLGPLIVGKLDSVCPKGLIFHGEDKLEDLLKAWPLYLIALNLPVPIEQHLLLTKKGVKKENFFEDPREALARYIDYYQTASENLSILMPKWGKSILNEGVVEPKADEDEVLEWLFRRDEMEWAAGWIEAWSPLLKKVFYEAV